MNARERGLRGVGTERLEWLAKLIMMNALAISTSLERLSRGGNDQPNDRPNDQRVCSASRRSCRRARSSE